MTEIDLDYLLQWFDELDKTIDEGMQAAFSEIDRLRQTIERIKGKSK